MAKILIILIGNELINGDIQDTNAKYLLEKLKGTSVSVSKIITIPDNKEIIVNNIKENLGLYNLIITSGGLGPTSDDITTECVGLALNQPLELDTASLTRLEDKYRKRDRPVLESSLKQVKFPKGAIVLVNEVGTADSFIANPEGETPIISLPGVPKEFKFFIDGAVSKWFKDKLKINTLTHYRHFRLFGLSEAHIGQIINDANLHKEVEALYRPQFPELLLSFRSDNKDLLESECIRIIKLIGEDYSYSETPEESFSTYLLKLLKEKGITIAAAESCTGGLFSSLLTAVPGASEVFLGSVVSYSNEMKNKFLSIPSELISRLGAVSEEVAREMARSIRVKTGASIGISATGIAGPGNSGSTKPVGLIYISINTKEVSEVIELNLPWDREMNQRYTAYKMIDLVRRSIVGQ